MQNIKEIPILSLNIPVQIIKAEKHSKQMSIGIFDHVIIDNQSQLPTEEVSDILSRLEQMLESMVHQIYSLFVRTDIQKNEYTNLYVSYPHLRLLPDGKSLDVSIFYESSEDTFNLFLEKEVEGYGSDNKKLAMVNVSKIFDKCIH